MNKNHNDYKKIMKMGRRFNSKPQFILYKNGQCRMTEYNKRFMEYAPLCYINGVEIEPLYYICGSLNISSLNSIRHMFKFKNAAKDSTTYCLLSTNGQLVAAINCFPIEVDIDGKKFKVECVSDVVDVFRHIININPEKFNLFDGNKKIEWL